MPHLDLENAAHYTREADERWTAARALAGKAAPLVPADRRQFFQSHVMTQLDIHQHSNAALRLASLAWADRPGAAAKMAGVIAELRHVLSAMQAAEYGKWKGFYAEDRFVDVRKSLALAEGAAARLAGRPLPEGLKLQPFVDDTYSWLKSYQNKRWVDVRLSSPEPVRQ